MQIYPIRNPEFRFINQNDVSVKNSEKKKRFEKTDPTAAPVIYTFCMVLKIAKDNNFYIPKVL